MNHNFLYFYSHRRQQSAFYENKKAAVTMAMDTKSDYTVIWAAIELVFVQLRILIIHSAMSNLASKIHTPL